MRYIIFKCLPLILLLLLMQTGCKNWVKPSTKPTVKVTIKNPGASSEATESFVCFPIEDQMWGKDEIESFTGVSSSERCDIYVQGPSNMDASTLAQMVDRYILSAKPRLPAEAQIGQAVDFSGKTLPSMSNIPKVEIIRVDIDYEKTAELGMPISAVHDAIIKGKASGKPLSEIKIAAQGGKLIPLSEIAKITKGHEPKYRVRHWPEEDNRRKSRSFRMDV
jgi:hypothetical protein